jgi:glycerol-3-phosphate acyltransferase PlsX
MKIAIDAMGGDNAPKAIVEGVMLAKKEFPEVEWLLFGDEAKVNEFVTDATNVTVVHTTQKIESEDEPVKAIRSKKDSSMVRAAAAVKAGEADAVISAGNTGALLAAGIFVVGRIKQIDRPALMTELPTVDGKGFVMLDLGANAENTAKQLENFATMGSFYAENVRGIAKPTIGLLNNGTEATKGTPVHQEAYELLAAREDLNFIGNVEASGLLSGAADVVVTDGFTGNAVLKTIEGTAKGMMAMLKQGISDAGIRGKLGAGIMMPALKSLKHAMDADAAGGAVLFGVKAPVVKTHGNSNAQAVAGTIRKVHKMLENNVVGKLTDHYSNTEEK